MPEPGSATPTGHIPELQVAERDAEVTQGRCPGMADAHRDAMSREPPR